MNIRTRILVTFVPLLVVAMGIVGILALGLSSSLRHGTESTAYNIRQLEKSTEDAGATIGDIIARMTHDEYRMRAAQLTGMLTLNHQALLRQLEKSARAEDMNRFVSQPESARAAIAPNLRRALADLCELYGVAEILVVDALGAELLRVVEQAPPVLGELYPPSKTPVRNMTTDESRTPWFAEAQQAAVDKPVSSVFFSRDFDTEREIAVLAVATPLTSGDRGTPALAGKTIGYLRFVTPLERFCAGILPVQREFKGELFLTDRHDVRVALAPPKALGTPFRPDDRPPQDYLTVTQPLIGNVLKLHFVMPMAELQKSAAVVHALSRSVRENAALVGDMSTRTRTGIRRFQQVLLAVIGLALLAAVAVALGMARAIAAPIEQLRWHANRMAQGHLADETPVAASGEVGELAADLDHMRDRLRRHIHGLDRQVASNVEALRDSEQKFRAVFNQSGVAIVRTDTTGHILESNPAARNLLLYNADEMLNLTIQDLTPPAESEAEREALLRVLAPGGASLRRRGTFVRKDGKPVPTDMTLSVVRDTRGKAQFVSVVIADIAEQLRNEEALRASEEAFRLLFARMPSGCAVHEIVCNEEGVPVNYKFLQANPAFERLTGLSIRDIIGKTILEVQPDVEPFWIETYGRVALTGEPTEFEHYNEPLGRYFFVSAYRPGPGRFAVVFNDATEKHRVQEEQRQIESQVQHAQKLESLGVLAGGIAHDFNNLLMAILGNADLALSEMPQESPGRREIREIEKASRRAAELCKQMLAYSGKGHFVVAPLDLNTLISDMAAMLKLSVSKNVVMHYNLDRTIPLIRADAAQMRQVVMNLIINGSEAIGEKSGVLAVSTGAMTCNAEYLRRTHYTDADTAPGLYTYLEVADTGVGMEPDVANRIFEPFFTTKFAGRGLGMSAVLGIVRGHRGAIRIDTRPGHGSTVRVLFPAAEEIPASKLEPSRGPATPRGSGTVLFVDDDETVLAVGSRMLEKAGFEVLKASDGREALAIFTERADDIACVVLDLTMPHMNGEETFHRMCDIRPDVRVVLSSGYNEDEIADRFPDRAPDGFIQKPYRGDELLEVLRGVLPG